MPKKIKVDYVQANESVYTKTSNSGKNKTSENHTPWEFFNNINGVITDYINKMVNIPSTMFTPAFVLPSKAYFKDAVRIIAIIKVVLHKFDRINERLDKNNNKTSKRKKIARFEILKSLEKEKWEVHYHKRSS